MQIANRHMKKKCSISLPIREMQVSTIMLLSHTYQNACYQTEKIPSIGKGLVRGESLCTVGVDINWYSQYARQFLKKLKKTSSIALSHKFIPEYLSGENETLI